MDRRCLWMHRVIHCFDSPRRSFFVAAEFNFQVEAETPATTHLLLHSFSTIAHSPLSTTIWTNCMASNYIYECEGDQCKLVRKDDQTLSVNSTGPSVSVDPNPLYCCSSCGRALFRKSDLIEEVMLWDLKEYQARSYTVKDIISLDKLRRYDCSLHEGNLNLVLPDRWLISSLI